jgi:hypothetical protein
MQNDRYTEWEISNDKCKGHRESTLSSDMNEQDLVIHQMVLLPGQACHNTISQTSKIPLPKSLSIVYSLEAYP